MRGLVILNAMLTFAGAVLAQRGGFSPAAGGFGMPPRPAPLGLPPLGPIPWLAPVQPFSSGPFFGSALPARIPRTPRFPLGGFTAFPVLGGSYYAAPAAPVQNVVVFQPAPPAMAPAPEPQPSRPQSVIREYPRPEAEAGPRAYLLVLTNGTRVSASAVWVDGDDLRYIDPEGGHWRVTLHAIDRDATRRANREQDLDLRLPPPPPQNR